MQCGDNSPASVFPLTGYVHRVLSKVEDSKG
jgi:hypothetical protein